MTFAVVTITKTQTPIIQYDPLYPMSILLEKSKENKRAFAFLKPHCPTPAVHCGYYSCYQLIVFILKELSLYDELKKGKGGTGASHGRCIKRISELYQRRTDRIEAQKLFDDLDGLKKFRLKADYHEYEIKSTDIEQVETILERIHTKIKKQFLE